MDPHENIREQLRHADLLSSEDPMVRAQGDPQRLAELVQALHHWRVWGGFDPYQLSDEPAPAGIAREVPGETDRERWARQRAEAAGDGG